MLGFGKKNDSLRCFHLMKAMRRPSKREALGDCLDANAYLIECLKPNNFDGSAPKRQLLCRI